MEVQPPMLVKRGTEECAFSCFGIEYCCERGKSLACYDHVLFPFPQLRRRQVQTRKDGGKMFSISQIKLVRHDHYHTKLVHAHACTHNHN